MLETSARRWLPVGSMSWSSPTPRPTSPGTSSAPRPRRPRPAQWSAPAPFRPAAQAKQAIDAGAQFLVTPGQGPDAAAIAETARGAGIPAILGAFTPSEVMTALALGSDAVKIFPAHQLGPKYFKDLNGPFPGVPLVPSGGINAGNARDYLTAGALAVSAGTDVVSPADVAAANWDTITAKAQTFCAALLDGDAAVAGP